MYLYAIDYPRLCSENVSQSRAPSGSLCISNAKGIVPVLLRRTLPLLQDSDSLGAFGDQKETCIWPAGGGHGILDLFDPPSPEDHLLAQWPRAGRALHFTRTRRPKGCTWCSCLGRAALLRTVWQEGWRLYSCLGRLALVQTWEARSIRSAHCCIAEGDAVAISVQVLALCRSGPSG